MNYTGNHIDLSLEKRWIEEAKRDPRAFEPLYTRYYDEIYRFIFRRTGREALTAELCSLTFYKALANINKYTHRSLPFGNWLYVIARNELKKHYRNRKEIFIVELDKVQEQIPVDEIINRAGNQQLIWVLQQLSDYDLHLIELKYFEQKTFKEVSILLNKSESAIKMHLYRLLLTMRKLINNHHDQA